jgi:ABC-2 type transport system ATP-binding protein
MDQLPLLSIQNLYKNYGNKEVLKDINLDIYPGQIIGYIGPNGAGKSTTVKILTGIIQDYSGSILYKGEDIKNQMETYKSQIGYVPELAELYDLLTPREYLRFIGALYNMKPSLVDERMESILSSFGLEANFDSRMDSFSKGMRQKVLLTAGIIHNPSVVILDEPLSGLDANSVIVIKELLQALKAQGKTIFYCSHMMDIVEKVSDRIVLIDQGVVVANGTIEALRSSENQSLETIFAQLTSTQDSSATAESIISALNNID